MKTSWILKSLTLAMLALSLSACPGRPDIDPELPGDGDNNGQTTTTTTLMPPSTTTTTLAPPTTTTTTTTTMPTTTTTTQPVACEPSGVIGTGDPGSLVINDGATETNSLQVLLKLAREEALEMKISNNKNCECGAWEPFASTKSWTLGESNKDTYVSVQFKDYDNVTTPCIAQRIKHDNLGPQIQLSLDPNNEYFTDSSTRLSFSVQDSGVGLQNYSCSSNGQSYACTNPSTLTWTQLAQGAYEFKVQATDRLGNSSTTRVTWNITQRYRDINHSVNITSNNKVDILMIIDNSGSMAYEQRNMAQRMSTFMEQVKDLDYKIAITTTDPSHKTYGDGRFVKMVGLNNQYVVTPSVPISQAQKIIGDTLQRDETGSPSEQGVYVTYRAIERSLSSESSPNKGFFRNDAGFATIIITDEDESRSNHKNMPQNLLNFVNNTWSDKKFAFHSIITRPGDRDCKSSNGYSYGYRYDEMSRLTGFGTVGGAIIGSVCEADYGSQLAGIGESVQQMSRTMDLQCEPIGDPTSSVVVLHNGSNYTAPYRVEGLKILFESNLPAGQYDLSYRCL